MARAEAEREARAAVRPPATDRTALRDGIRRALAEADGFNFDSLERHDYQKHADMVLAVLPSPADRAAVLLRAADAIDRETQALKDAGVLEPDKFRPCRDASAQLREMTALPVDRTAVVAATADEVERIFAAELNGERALTLLDALIVLRSKLPCTCCRSGGLHDQVCRRYVAGHELLSPARRLDRAREELRLAAEPAAPGPDQTRDEEPVVCEGFQWIGQSFATCDRCGQPAWDHAGQDVAVDGAGPFDNRRTVRPWGPGEADAIRAKWGTPSADASAVGGAQQQEAAVLADATPQPATCTNCQGSGLDPRYSAGGFDCPDCPPAAPAQQPKETRP
jgi:hypothetical protein